MANIKLNLNIIEQFITKNNLSDKISNSEVASIFDEANQYLEDGSKGKDEYLTNDEVPTFQRLLKEKCSSFAKYYGRFLQSLIIKDNGDVDFVKCNKSEKEIELYKENLKKAKDIINDNYKRFCLTDEENNYIQNASAVIENKDCARYDRESDSILFNLNEGKSIPSIGSFVKVLIHEATHSTLNKVKDDTKEDERKCETRALQISYQLYKEGKIDNFELMQNYGKYIKDLEDPKELDKYINMWLELGYRNHPEK